MKKQITFLAEISDQIRKTSTYSHTIIRLLMFVSLTFPSKHFSQNKQNENPKYIFLLFWYIYVFTFKFGFYLLKNKSLNKVWMAIQLHTDTILLEFQEWINFQNYGEILILHFLLKLGKLYANKNQCNFIHIFTKYGTSSVWQISNVR